MPAGETEINIALAELLSEMRPRWVAMGEPLGTFIGSAKRPDVLVTEYGVAPVVVETEVLPAYTVEEDARARLGEKLTATGATVTAVIAVRVPEHIRLGSSTALLALRAASG